MYRGIISIVFAFIFWGHFIVESLIFSFAGALLFFGSLFLLKKLIPIYVLDVRQEEQELRNN
jgi:hypothetical protein